MDGYFSERTHWRIQSKHETTHLQFVATILKWRFHRHGISQTQPWSNGTSVEKQICRMINTVSWLLWLALCLTMMNNVGIRTRRKSWLSRRYRPWTFPNLLFLTGYCGASFRGSSNWNCEYQTCFIFPIQDWEVEVLLGPAEPKT